VTDNKRIASFPDFLFDSNLIDKDPDRNKETIDLAKLLISNQSSGNIWFSILSLAEILASKNAATRIELLKRFQSLYSELGDRVRFIGSNLLESVHAEWSGRGLMSAPVSAMDRDVNESIATGELVGILKTVHESWKIEKEMFCEDQSKRVRRAREEYGTNELFRGHLKKCIAAYGTTDALEQCEIIARRLIVDVANQPSESVLLARTRYEEYPCTWTFSLLIRLADYAATLTDAEWKSDFSQYGRLVEKQENDAIDAYIATAGGKFGTLITNDGGLIKKINFLHDARPPLIRLRALTVEDAMAEFKTLRAYFGREPRQLLARGATCQNWDLPK